MLTTRRMTRDDWVSKTGVLRRQPIDVAIRLERVTCIHEGD